jgi:hypothetical protein
MHTSKVALDKRIVAVVKLGKRVSGRDFGQTPPRLLPYLRVGSIPMSFLGERRGS